jgi:hypothetical protein
MASLTAVATEVMLPHGIFMHVPPVQLSPKEHVLPQRPQLLLSVMKEESLTHLPMQLE